jgi:putative membrane protein
LIMWGYYTYAEVPLGFWLQDWFGFTRNHYDRIGHITQGVVPAILMREIYRRKAQIENTRWLFLFVVSFCLAFSAFFEMIEWWSAIAFWSGSDAFLGTQGDIWDAQWDMFFCLIGSTMSLVLLWHWHEKQIQKIQK